MNAITFNGSYIVPAGKVLIITGMTGVTGGWSVGSTLPAGTQLSFGAGTMCGILKNATT